MPAHKLVSGKEIVARVIRAIGYKLPSTYIDDILEWIPEAMGQLQITNTLVLKQSGDQDCVGELQVTNYCIQLPCDFLFVEKLEDEFGSVITEGHGVNRMSEAQVVRRARVSSFEVNPFNHQTSDGLPTDDPGSVPPYYLDGSDIITSPHIMNPSFYVIRGNRLQLSFETGFVKLTYWALPLCEEGYPLIPDNDNYKQAIEWYIIKRLIGSGYEHKVFSYKDADEYFEKYAARGMAEVSFYSPDGAEKLHRTVIRLMPPTNYRNDFFQTDIR